MDSAFLDRLRTELTSIDEAGLYKRERIITSHQGPEITVAGRTEPVLNFCANNYLGLSSHPDVISAAKQYLDSHGFGMSSVRFICGTQDIHKELEKNGIVIDRHAIELEKPVKKSGKTEVSIRLHPDGTTRLTITVDAGDSPAGDEEA